MVDYVERISDRKLDRYLRIFGAVVLQGARATGKSTSGVHAAASQIRLDSSPNLPALVQTDPSVALEGETPRLIDEWQLAPQVWNSVRHEVDMRQLAGQFILTGSATPSDDITRHSGAGRFGRISLRTFSLAEAQMSTRKVDFAQLLNNDQSQGSLASFGGPRVADYVDQIIRGGWPMVSHFSQSEAQEYLASYLDDVARVDIRIPMQDGLASTSDPQRVWALIRALARNTATEVSVAKLAIEAEVSEGRVGIDQKSARKYLDQLSRIFVLEELPAWHTHIRSKVRLRVSPKWHFIDPSLAASALQLSSKRLLDDPNCLGFFFESLAIRDIRIYSDALSGSVFHYRDDAGLEVDAIVELRDGIWAGFEIILGGDKWIDAGAENLKRLRAKVTDARQRDLASLNVITAGVESYTRPDGVNVISLGHLFI
ncbi:MAG: DUF4143 domain-containing protein [Propionibacteriaceae bacterium]|jgi:predicted AAA+ superfamily ATPase|nr:DUF4143 domain-containing protein [Propionibacteriaceae bacterium]